MGKKFIMRINLPRQVRLVEEFGGYENQVELTIGIFIDVSFDLQIQDRKFLVEFGDKGGQFQGLERSYSINGKIRMKEEDCQTRHC